MYRRATGRSKHHRTHRFIHSWSRRRYLHVCMCKMFFFYRGAASNFFLIHSSKKKVQASVQANLFRVEAQFQLQDKIQSPPELPKTCDGRNKDKAGPSTFVVDKAMPKESQELTKQLLVCKGGYQTLSVTTGSRTWSSRTNPALRLLLAPVFVQVGTTGTTFLGYQYPVFFVVLVASRTSSRLNT